MRPTFLCVALAQTEEGKDGEVLAAGGGGGGVPRRSGERHGAALRSQVSITVRLGLSTPPSRLPPPLREGLFGTFHGSIYL